MEGPQDGREASSDADDAADHVRPGGPMVERRDGPLVVRKRAVSDMDNDVYVLACVRTGAALVVDAADDAPGIRAMLDGLHPLAVVQTHGHWDHVRPGPTSATIRASRSGATRATSTSTPRRRTGCWPTASGWPSAT
jgi:hypothetical protein